MLSVEDSPTPQMHSTSPWRFDMTLLEQLSRLSSAEDFFLFLDVPYEPAVLHVARLHILRRMGDNLRNASPESDDTKARACFRAHLERAYQDFVRSSPIRERVFKVHQDAIRPIAPPLVQLAISISQQSVSSSSKGE